MGFLVGAAMAVLLLALLFEWALFKRVCDDPVVGKSLSVLAAWLAASAIYGFGAADGGAYKWNGFILYGIVAVPILVWFYRKGVKGRQEIAEMGHSDTFD